MDKNTLSQYGWVVIVIIVLVLLIALATPFGNYVGDSVMSSVNAFTNKMAAKMEEAGLDTEGLGNAINGGSGGSLTGPNGFVLPQYRNFDNPDEIQPYVNMPADFFVSDGNNTLGINKKYSYMIDSAGDIQSLRDSGYSLEEAVRIYTATNWGLVDSQPAHMTESEYLAAACDALADFCDFFGISRSDYQNGLSQGEVRKLIYDSTFASTCGPKATVSKADLDAAAATYVKTMDEIVALKADIQTNYGGNVEEYLAIVSDPGTPVYLAYKKILTDTNVGFTEYLRVIGIELGDENIGDTVVNIISHNLTMNELFIIASNCEYNYDEFCKRNDYSLSKVDLYSYTPIPSKIGGETITTIPDSLFKNNMVNLSPVVVDIPDSITDFGTAFRECSTLAYVIIGNGVTQIKANAFYNDFNLLRIDLPNTITSIGSNAFYNCIALKEIIIPASVTSINAQAFASCPKANLTIKGTAGSYAETWANSNGYTFVAI